MKRIKYYFWDKQKGAGGTIETPEDFGVEEVIDRKFLQRFERTKGGVSTVKGPYSLCLLTKRNATTLSAINKICKKLNIKKIDIGYAGLKDKFAVTKQYVTIKNVQVDSIKLDGIELKEIRKTNRHIGVGDLTGNKFAIKLHDCRNLEIKTIAKNVEKYGLPNYFGPQRFGKYCNNHTIGRLIVKRRFSEALKLINANYLKDSYGISGVEKRKIKFFINAYQSWIFNEALKTYMKHDKKSFFGAVSLFGYTTKLTNNPIDKITARIAKKECIAQKDFRIDELRICCTGGVRDAFVNVSDLRYDKSGNNMLLHFTLPKGSYATVLLKYLE